MIPRSMELRNNKKIPVIFHKSIFLHDKYSNKNVQFNKFPINLSHYESINCKVLKNLFNSKFKVKISKKKNTLIIKRVDKNEGWTFEINLEIKIKKKKTIEILHSINNNFTKIYSIYLKNDKIFNEKYSTTDIYDILNPSLIEDDIESESNDNVESNDEETIDLSKILEKNDDKDLNDIKDCLLDIIKTINKNNNQEQIKILTKKVENIKKQISYKIYSKDKLLYNSNNKSNNNIELVISEKRKENFVKETCSVIIISGNFFNCCGNNIFKNCIKKIIQIRKKVIIIIHSWLVFKNKFVNIKIIENYFGKEISKHIQHIEISNYEDVNKKHNLPPQMKTISFLKNKWYSLNKVTKLLSVINKNFDMVININFDTFNKINSWKLGINQKSIIHNIKKNIYEEKIIILNNTIQDGISNFYIGSYEAVRKLHHAFDNQFLIIYSIFKESKFPDEVFFHVVKKLNTDLIKEQKKNFLLNN